MDTTFHESRENTAMDHTPSLHVRRGQVNAGIGDLVQIKKDQA
jgi:hypothetical protein